MIKQYKNYINNHNNLVKCKLNILLIINNGRRANRL